MNASRPTQPVSRRAVVTGLGAGSLALAASRLGVSAQDASPAAMTSHPIVGAWVVDPEPDNPAVMPTTNVYTADGGLIDPTTGAAGVWEATGSRTVNFTLIGFEADSSGYFIVRGSQALDAAGNAAAITYSGTIVAHDGTVVDQFPDATATSIRLRVEPQDAVGTSLAGLKTWTPEAATPAP